MCQEKFLKSTENSSPYCMLIKYEAYLNGRSMNWTDMDGYLAGCASLLYIIFNFMK